MHLTLSGCVAIRFKMLAYCVYAPRLNRIDALSLNVIYNFETTSNTRVANSSFAAHIYTDFVIFYL